MKDNLEIFVSGDTTTSQLAAQVAACRAENPSLTIVVLTESADWQQARAAFAAGASDYRANGMCAIQHYVCSTL